MDRSHYPKGLLGLFVGCAMLVAACGGGINTGLGSGTPKLPGKVCDLVTPAEIEGVVRFGQQSTGTETAEPDVDRSCLYMVGGAVPVVALSLQGEHEKADWPAIKALPGSTAVSLRGADASFWPTTNVLYVHKNGLVVAVQVVVPPAGETYQTAAAKLAESIAGRLP